MEEPKEIEEIITKQDFINFVIWLKDDKIDEDRKESVNPSSPYSSGQNGWKNNTIPHFLDSIAAFAQDSHHINEKPIWRNFALLLLAGKFYE